VANEKQSRAMKVILSKGKRNGMKVLIAYDGSESADKGIDDLRRAALPMEAAALIGRRSVAPAAGA
jgi:hypothetical protein